MVWTFSFFQLRLIGVDLETLKKVADEISHELAGHRFGKIFALSRLSMAVDFRSNDSRYLFISVEPSDPRMYLIRRRVRDLEKQSSNPSQFSLLLKKHLSGAVLSEILVAEDERVVRLSFEAENEMGDSARLEIVAQLTGKSANLFLLNEERRILDSLRETNGDGQEPGTIYSPPVRPDKSKPPMSAQAVIVAGSVSETLDAADLEKRANREFSSMANAARGKIKQEISKREKLRKKLIGDLAEHGDAEKWKRFGDLLLANVSTAKRNDGKISVVDYFDEGLATVEIDADENDSITETAEKFFKKYTKARNAGTEIARRLAATDTELARLRKEQERLEETIAEKDLDRLIDLIGKPKETGTKKERAKETALSSIARSFTSSDGFEILVGKKAKDNDFLTFRIAKSLDTWMHAADYPGSHVVVRNPNRKEIPQQTLLEAAQLAAFYSQGKAQPKAAVHYTQKKFVNKPKGSAPGLVSLASFKTLLVEPIVPVPKN